MSLRSSIASIPLEPKPQGHVSTISAILSMDRTQWLVFAATYLAWALDMFDVSLIPLSLPLIAKEFNVPPSSVAFAITCMMITRSIGCLFWGWASDIYGRKSFATGLTTDLTSFIVIRSIFGFAMGGEWGLGTALCMETVPVNTRGFFSGTLQSGTYLGFLLASITFRFVSAHPNAYSWHTLFYFSLIPSFLVFLLCLCIPESPVWLETQRLRKEAALSSSSSIIGAEEKHTTSYLIKKYTTSFWIMRVLYLVFMIAAMSLVFHATYDLYPTILMVQHGLSPDDVGLVMILQSIAALIGGPLIGLLSQSFLSRKTTMLIAYVALTAFTYPYNLSSDRTTLLICSSIVQFIIAGGSSQIPAHLSELSPAELRATVPGFAFNVGQTLTAPLPQVIALIAESLPKVQDHGVDVTNYGLVSFIISVIAIILTVIMIYFGPENKGGHLGIDATHEEEQGFGLQDIEPEYSIPNSHAFEGHPSSTLEKKKKMESPENTETLRSHTEVQRQRDVSSTSTTRRSTRH